MLGFFFLRPSVVERPLMFWRGSWPISIEDNWRGHNWRGTIGGAQSAQSGFFCLQTPRLSEVVKSAAEPESSEDPEGPALFTSEIGTYVSHVSSEASFGDIPLSGELVSIVHARRTS